MSRQPMNRPMPEDFAQYARTERVYDLAKRFRASVVTVTRWKREAGVEREVRFRNDKKPIPTDFAERAAEMTRGQLEAHYGVTGALDRWMRETGIRPKQHDRIAAAKQNPQPRATVHRSSVLAFDRVQHDMSLVGRAAEHVRPLAPLVRCDAKGRPMPKGKFWLRGGRYVKTDEEILELAYRKGFDPDAWKRLGAAA